MLKTARDRQKYEKEINKTGGGSLTPNQRKILKSPLYADLANKLGKSASGGSSRFDSDAMDSSNPPPPSKRLRDVLSTNTETSDDLDTTVKSSSSVISGTEMSRSVSVNSVSSQDDLFLIHDDPSRRTDSTGINLSEVSIEDDGKCFQYSFNSL